MATDGLTSQQLDELDEIVRAWAKERKSELIGTIRQLGLTRTMTLLRSIRSGVRSFQGEAHTIYFKYQYYGLFHEVGATNVGRGKINLPARHWLRNDLYGRNLEKLIESISEMYAEFAVNAIKIDDVRA